MNITTTHKRIIWLDLLKALAIFFVIWGHVIHHCGFSIHDYTSVCGWTYSFHMPLFMTLSGFVSIKLLSGEAVLICFLTFPVICRIPIVSFWKIDFMLPFFVLGLTLSKN